MLRKVREHEHFLTVARVGRGVTVKKGRGGGRHAARRKDAPVPARVGSVPVIGGEVGMPDTDRLAYPVLPAGPRRPVRAEVAPGRIR